MNCVTVLIAALLIACGADAYTNVSIIGGGATFPQMVYREWMMLYRVVRTQFVTANMFYDPVGSGTGQKYIQSQANPAPGQVVYAGSDSLLPDAVYIKSPELQMFPSCAGAVVVVFNLPGINDLAMHGYIVADIFSGRITRWNDNAIQSLNTNVRLPNEKIILVARAVSSGTTSIFTGGMALFSQNWRAGTFSDPKRVGNTSLFSATIDYWTDTSIGVAGLVASLPFTISYLTMSDVVPAGLHVVSLYNRAGTLITMDELNDGLESAMNFNNKNMGPRLTASLLDAPTIDAYPLASFTYMIVNMTTSPNISCNDVAEFVRYARWFMEDPQAISAVLENEMVPITSGVATRITEEVLKKITCKGQLAWSMMLAQQQEEANSVNFWLNFAKFGAPMFVGLIGVFLGYISYSRYKIRKKINARIWHIKHSDVHYHVDAQSHGTLVSSHKTESLFSKSFETEYLRARVDDRDVLVFPVTNMKWIPEKVAFKTSKTLHELCQLRNENIMRFVGITIETSDKLIRTSFLYDMNVKQNLHHLLMNCPYELSDEVKYALAVDAARGLKFLHATNIVHGRLNTLCCFVDPKWTIKIGDWLEWRMKQMENMPIKTSYLTKDRENPNEMWPLVFNDPLILQYEANKQPIVNPPKAFDIYSFGVMLIEIFTRKIPFSHEAKLSSWATVLGQILENKGQPFMDEAVPGDLRAYIMGQLLSEDRRPPSFQAIIQKLSTFSRSKNHSLIETMLEAMDNFMENLQNMVKERTAEVETMTVRMESLLENMLPKEVVVKLRNNEKFEPEFFNEVTIYFSDIVCFTNLCQESSALEVVNMLNSLFTMFDSIIEQFDVYKVETIGDAYMCVSGLPKRNGGRHVFEIAKMALAIVQGISAYRVPHRPDHRLQIRIGLNSGSVMAGVVGLKMPRYCLFGDTVNTASRMESTGLPSKIQCTQLTADLLRNNQFGIRTVERGLMAVKGKGDMRTYFVEHDTAKSLAPVLAAAAASAAAATRESNSEKHSIASISHNASRAMSQLSEALRMASATGLRSPMPPPASNAMYSSYANNRTFYAPK